MGKKYFTRKGKYALAALSLLLVLALALQMAGATAAAQAVDLSRECTLTVQTAGDEEVRVDLRGADIVLDVYKVADAVKIPGVDSYTYEMVEPFTGLSVSEDITGDGWRELSQLAGEIAFGGLVDGAGVLEGWQKPEPVATVPAEAGSDEIEIGVAGSNTETLDCGLYLIVARGGDLKEGEYADRIKMKDTVENENGEKVEVEEDVLVSKARTSVYEYYFLPELVSLPGKMVEDENGEKIPATNTADSGEWTYDMAVTLKPDREYRFGSLEIVKTLSDYETAAGMKEPVTFVFSIEARMGEDAVFENNELVYSNVVSVTFTDPGQKSALVERLPAGARVRVTEVYSGSSYEPVTPAEVTGLTVEANAVVQAEFTNTYNHRNRSGYGINNKFTYNGNGWDLEQDEWNWGSWVEAE